VISTRRSALHYACSKGNVSVAEVLLSHSADGFDLFPSSIFERI
jgi:ankyrin repeat protein